MTTVATFQASEPGNEAVVFDRLQYKNRGEGLGERVTCVTSVRREGGGARLL